MKVALLAAVAVASLALASGTLPPPSGQELLLREAITGNFACKVDSLEVTLDQNGAEELTTIKVDDLKAALTRTATLEWAHVNQFFFAATDGRNMEKSLNTPGGDLGEFILALHADTKQTGNAYSAEDVGAKFEIFLKTMSKEKFYFETDERAYLKLAIKTGCPNLKIAEMPDRAKKKAIADAMNSEDAHDFIGDPFLKFLYRNADALDFKKEYISYAITAFHQALWANDDYSKKLCYTEVKGRVDPKAIIHVKTPGYCVDQGLAPLISSQMCSGQVFIDHGDAVKLYRRELVQLLVATDAAKKDQAAKILATFNEEANKLNDAFYATLAPEPMKGIPVFTIKFMHSSLEQADELDGGL